MRVVLILLALLCGAPAFAADSAGLAILGFSADGRRFAFEEFGRQDGSGFPYASIFLIDTAANSFAAPPVHVRLDDENATIGAARREAAAKARALIRPITEPGERLAGRAIAEAVDEPNRHRFRLGTFLPNGEEPSSLVLTEIPMGEAGGDRVRGFRLTFTDRGEARVIHEDRTLPARRSTAQGYRLGDVVAYRAPRGGAGAGAGGGLDVLVVMVMVMQRGFEGSDVRHMAVTAPLPAR
jgi:predicted secreted protein